MQHHTHAPVLDHDGQHQLPAEHFGQIADVLYALYGLTIAPGDPDRPATTPDHAGMLVQPTRRPDRPRLILADGLSMDDRLAALIAAGRVLMAGDDAAWKPAPEGRFISLAFAPPASR
jgi:hypothetical protein